ncbi:hypothetical protein CR513_55022, partial [Mucuna pruriens]
RKTTEKYASSIGGQSEGQYGKVYATDGQPANWTAEPLMDEFLFAITNNEPSPNSDMTPACEDPSPIEGPAEDEDAETEALAEVERQIEQERPKFQPLTKELESVNLGNEGSKKEVRIGNQMSPESRKALVEFLQEFSDIFAWSYRDMPGLDRSIVEHRLPMLPKATPVRQQLRRMKPDVALKIKEEVEKQWDAGFLAVSNYPQWVANIVPVPKKDGKVRMCVDYRDLNQASPKDNFPLPHIDMLVDNTTCHAFFSFMDGFSGYNQILMAEEDREKTTFVTL